MRFTHQEKIKTAADSKHLFPHGNNPEIGFKPVVPGGAVLPVERRLGIGCNHLDVPVFLRDNFLAQGSIE